MTVTTLNRVPATLTYYAPPEDGSKPWITNWPGPDGERIKNYKTKAFPFEVEDVRGNEGKYGSSLVFAVVDSEDEQISIISTRRALSSISCPVR